MEYYEVAAKWWADKLRSIRSSSKKKNINLFEERLAKVIKESVEKTGSITLSFDYAPDSTLFGIARETKVCFNDFPNKVRMNITSTAVSVKCGYGSSLESIFPK